MSPDNTAALPLVHLVRPAEIEEGVKPPLLLLLHGIGSNERDLFSFANFLDPRCVVICVRAPIFYGGGGYSWFNVDLSSGKFRADETQVLSSLATLQKFIVGAIATYEADPRRIYIGGFSQGGFMALLTGLSQPQNFAGIVSMSGRLTHEVEPLFGDRAAMEGLPIVMVHGIHDPVIPIAAARETRDIVAKLPVDLDYHEFDMVHEVSLPSLETILTWLSVELSNPWESPAQTN